MKTNNSCSRVKCCVALGCLALLVHLSIRATIGQDAASPAKVTEAVPGEVAFKERIQPLFQNFCVRCHDAENMESGIRVDQLTGAFDEKQLPLWKGILQQVTNGDMPPADEPQLSADQRMQFADWITQGMNAARSRPTPKNGSVRRLTVTQYRNTLRDLLGLQEDLTDALPPDGISKDGFANNGSLMALSPLQIETYFDIAQKSLDLCIVDEASKPVIQNFRMEFGESINKTPCPDNLILGANNALLKNSDFVVSELQPTKPFDFQPFAMQTKFEFIEGYVGNDTIRAWKKFDSIYHAVFACVRGSPGYPKGQANQVIPSGLALRPAIPSGEIFGQSNTYGPMANFKISLRELPAGGNFRVTVKAAKYNDGLLLDPGTVSVTEHTDAIICREPTTNLQTVTIKQPGVYQVDAHLAYADAQPIAADGTKLAEGLIGVWDLNGDATGESRGSLREPTPVRGANSDFLTGRLTGDAKFVDSPFGKAVSLDGNDDAVVIPRHETMNVDDGEFTVAAWIHPKQLRQAGIVCLGKYSWTHGWYLDMPNNQGVLRFETAGPNNQSNGTVQSPPGALRVNTWQHVAAVVRREGKGETQLFINGYPVAKGNIRATNLDNPKVDLHIGRIQEAHQFAGDIDEVRIYRRTLGEAEIQALVEPGRRFVSAPPREKPQELAITLGDRHVSGILNQPAFLAVRLAAGELPVSANYHGTTKVDRLVFTPLAADHELAKRFSTFEKRSPSLGVYLGLRRDCGSTLTQVGEPRAISNNDVQEFVFEGAINDYPTPDVEKDNVNYLAGIREIGVRSEFTDGRDMPRLLVKSIEFEGPFYDSWPPTTHRNIFIDSPVGRALLPVSPPKDSPVKQTENATEKIGRPTTAEITYAREVIRSFATRAFRRPVTDAEFETIFTVWKNSFADKHDAPANGSESKDANHSLTLRARFQQSIKDALLVVLTSPQFLFLIENSSSPAAEQLDAYELASKLSYFLWNAPPDQRLLDLAAKNVLHQSLDDEIERMIRDPRFSQFVSEFASQWLSLDKFEVVSIDTQRYPKLTRDTKTQLRQEPVQFLRYLIEQNLPVRNLVQSDVLIANEVTASYYSLADRTESGFQFVPIKHETTNLGGVLTHAAILAGLSDGRESNPVKRGAWLARKIIAMPPDDPPPNVPKLPEDDGAKLTLREKLERHRNQKGCVKCHTGIDPWGLPFESFDAGGLWHGQESGQNKQRGQEAGQSKEALNSNTHTKLPDGKEVADLNGLKSYLANDRIDQVAFSFLKHAATYATGRTLTYNELAYLREQCVQTKATDYHMQELLRFVIKSDLFLKK